jgi:hypothetical protein
MMNDPNWPMVRMPASAFGRTKMGQMPPGHRQTFWALAILSLLALALVTCTSPAPLATPPRPTISYPAEPAANFAFRFEYGICYDDALDTFDGRLTKDLAPEPSVTVPFRLSDDQMLAIYQEMVEIGFFEYPRLFYIPAPEEGEAEIVTPAMNYRIIVQNGDLIKEVIWKDEVVKPLTPEARQLRNLFRHILRMIESHPDYHELREPKHGCS